MHISVYARWSVEKRITDADDDDDDDDVSESAREKAAHTQTQTSKGTDSRMNGDWIVNSAVTWLNISSLSKALTLVRFSLSLPSVSPPTEL